MLARNMCTPGAITIVMAEDILAADILAEDITDIPIGAPILIGGPMAGLIMGGLITADPIIVPTRDIIIARAILILSIIIRAGFGNILFAGSSAGQTRPRGDCAWPQKRQEFGPPSARSLAQRRKSPQRRAWEAI